ncbi:MAG: tetratricopeptide repeat protein, partial [Akkermansiaceae bacterium]|nr:tetratricopeptide repeat protein [Akkermansiaceae bacterium]
MRAVAATLEKQAALLHRRAIARQIAASLEPGTKDGLLRAALLLARLDNPEVDVEAYLEEIERMAGEIASTLPEEATNDRKIGAVRTYLFHDNGFHGSRLDYYSRANSYLNEVIDDREGIPITLSLLVVELGRRVGAELHGLGLPGHFVACYQEGDQRRIIDPFEGGAPMKLEDANALLAAAGFRETAAEFSTATPRDIIRRMLNNLKAIAIEEKDFQGAIGYVDVLLTLDPGNPQERLGRALLHLQLGEGNRAKPDLEWLLEHK